MAMEDKAKVLNEQVTDVNTAREHIAHRAYELYEQRGRVDGFDAQDWFQAELQILGQNEPSDAPAPRRKSQAAGGQTAIRAKASKQT